MIFSLTHSFPHFFLEVAWIFVVERLCDFPHSLTLSQVFFVDFFWRFFFLKFFFGDNCFCENFLVKKFFDEKSFLVTTVTTLITVTTVTTVTTVA